MAMSAPSSLLSLSYAVVIDANVLIAICAKEAGREPLALAELSHYSSQGYEFYAPGIVISEVLYVLCGKEQNGTLAAADYQRTILELESIASGFLSPPKGEGALIIRSTAIRAGLRMQSFRRQHLYSAGRGVDAGTTNCAADVRSRRSQPSRGECANREREGSCRLRL